MKNTKVINPVFAGSFTPDDVPPTCMGLIHIIYESQQLEREQFLETAKEVMNAIWNQRPSSKEIQLPVSFKNISEMISTIKDGWEFNANEADTIWMVFGDMKIIKRGDSIVGIGVFSPDGAIIRDGRELVLWRQRKWASLAPRSYKKPELKIVR